MISIREKNNLIITFILTLLVFISCMTTLDANDLDAADALYQIAEIEPENNPEIIQEEIEPEITQEDFFIFPLQTREITSYFGHRRDPINGGRHFHNGVDFSARIGETVTASMDGIVSLAVYHAGYGNYVTINHSNGYKTLYCHLNSFSVKQGDTVEKGQKIGESGNTGNSSGPHLHFGMIGTDDKPVNPLEFLRQETAQETSQAASQIAME